MWTSDVLSYENKKWIMKQEFLNESDLQPKLITYLTE